MKKVVPSSGNDINGFIHNFPLLNVTCVSKSKNRDTSICWNAINASHNYHFCSDQSSGQWFQFNFPNVLVKTTHYSLQAPVNSMNGWHMPKSWEFFGLKADGRSISIDNVTESGLNEDKKIVTYQVKVIDSFTGFRLLMKGYNYKGDSNELRIYKIDVFGTMMPMFNRLTCKLRSKTRINTELMVLLTSK